jgi:hypothetical protein
MSGAGNQRLANELERIIRGTAAAPIVPLAPAEGHEPR